MLNLYTLGVIGFWLLLSGVVLSIMCFIGWKILEMTEPCDHSKVLYLNNEIRNFANTRAKLQRELSTCGRKERKLLTERWGEDVIKGLS